MGKGSRKKSKLGFNPLIGKLKATKRQIVQREIDTCVDLYFSFGDLVSIHVLISAAHEILKAYDKASSKTGMLFDEVEALIKRELLDDYRELISRPYINFKHGAKNLDTMVELPDRLTETLLLSAIEKYQEVTKCPTAKMLLLRNWLYVQHHLLTPEGEVHFHAPALRKRFPIYARKEYRRAYYPAFVKLVANWES